MGAQIRQSTWRDLGAEAHARLMRELASSSADEITAALEAEYPLAVICPAAGWEGGPSSAAIEFRVGDSVRGGTLELLAWSREASGSFAVGACGARCDTFLAGAIVRDAAHTSPEFEAGGTYPT